MEGEYLFEKVLELSGLSRVLGPGIIKRSLAETGVEVAAAKTDHYREALPRLEARLRIYMSDSEATRRAGRIAGFLAHADGQLASEDPRDWSMFGKSVDILKQARQQLSESQEVALDLPGENVPDDDAAGG